MAFQPTAKQELYIDGITYAIAEHPALPGKNIPYGQAGKAGTVFQLVAQEGKDRALKVFKPAFQLPELAGQALRIAPLAALPGLRACQRTVLSALRHGGLLHQYPDLLCAVLMPWFDIIDAKSILTPAQSLMLAHELTKVLATMEEQGIAHCDLSGPNVLLPVLQQGEGSELSWIMWGKKAYELERYTTG